MLNNYKEVDFFFIFLLILLPVRGSVHTQSPLSCSTLCSPIDCRPADSSVHGILHAIILEWFAMPSPGNLPNPGIEPISLTSPALAGGFFFLNHQYHLGSPINRRHLVNWIIPDWSFYMQILKPQESIIVQFCDFSRLLRYN